MANRRAAKGGTKSRKVNGLSAGTVIAACICAIVCAAAASFRITEDGVLFLAVNSLQSYLVLVVTAFAFVRLRREGSLELRIPVLLVAVLFSAMTVAGLMLDGAATLQATGVDIAGRTAFSGGVLALVVELAMLCGYALFYYLVVLLLYSALQGLRVAPRKKDVTLFGRPLRARLVVLVLLVAWLPYLVVFFPGLPSTDASHQMAQFFGVAGLLLDTHFPYFVSLVHGGLHSLGCLVEPGGYLGLFLMMLLQVALGLFAFSVIVSWIGSLGMPRWFVLLALAFFALFPLVPVYMVTIGKDTLHAELLALLVFQLLMLSVRRDARELPFGALLSPLAVGVNALLIALTRNGSILVVLVALLVCAIAFRRGGLAVAGAGVLALFCAWQLVALPAMGVQSEGSREMLSMPAQVVASHVRDGLPLDESTYERLDDHFGGKLDVAADTYVFDWADTTKVHLVVESTEETVDFLQLAGSVAAQDLMHALAAALSTTYGTWYPFCLGSYFNEDAPYYCMPGDGWSFPEWIGPDYDSGEIKARITVPAQLLHLVHFIPGFSQLYAPAFYTWLIILLLGLSFYARAFRARTFAVLSPFLMLVLIMLAGPCASLRYVLPMVLSIPLFVTLVLMNRMPASSKGR